MKRLDFYVYLLVYMFVRLSINMTSAMIPFYMDLNLGFHPKEGEGTRVEISIVLIINTLGSVFNSIFLQKQIEKIGNKKNERFILMMFAFIFACIGCVPIFFITESISYILYIISFFLGIGFSLGLSSASFLVNDLVGNKGSKGAFVYGAYSFIDKLSSGVVLAILLPIAKDEPRVLKWSMPFFPAGTIIFALGIIYFYGRSKVEPEIEENNDDILNASNILENCKFTFIAAK